MTVKNDGVTKFWSINSSGKKTEQEQLKEQIQTALEIIKRLEISLKGLPNDLRRCKKASKNLEIVKQLALSTSDFILKRNSVLIIGKLAGALRCKNDEDFKKTYVNDETTDTRASKMQETEPQLSQWLHLNSVELLMDACQYESDNTTSLDRLEREFVSFVNKWDKIDNYKKNLATQMLHLLSEKRPTVWGHPQVSKLFDRYINLYGLTQLWKFAQWYLKADSKTANNQTVRDNLYALIEKMRHSKQPFDISAQELSELYERLMKYETREDTHGTKILYYSILVEQKLDWKNCSKTTLQCYHEALVGRCKISDSLRSWNQEAMISTAPSEISSDTLNQFTSLSGLYKQEDTFQLQWKLWSENIGKPALTCLSLSPLAFRNQWLSGINRFNIIWKNCVKNADKPEELNALSEKEKVLYMECHAEVPYYHSTSFLLKYLFLAIDYALKNENNNSTNWASQLSQLSDETQIRITQFWLLGECTLAPFPPMDMPILNELMPLLLRLYPLKSREIALLQALQATTDTTFVCKEGQTIACHRAFIENALPNLPWIGDQTIFECPELSRDLLEKYVLTKIYGVDIDLIQKEPSNKMIISEDPSKDDFAKLVAFVEKHGNKFLSASLIKKLNYFQN